MEILSKIAIAFTQGGVWMWAILVLQVVAISIIVERVVALYLRRKPTQLATVGGFEDLIRKGDLEAVNKRPKSWRERIPSAEPFKLGFRRP